MSIMMAVFSGGVIALVVWAIRSFTGPKRNGEDAFNKLRQRLASGAITQDEFEKTKKVLQAS